MGHLSNDEKREEAKYEKSKKVVSGHGTISFWVAGILLHYPNTGCAPPTPLIASLLLTLMRKVEKFIRTFLHRCNKAVSNVQIRSHQLWEIYSEAITAEQRESLENIFFWLTLKQLTIPLKYIFIIIIFFKQGPMKEHVAFLLGKPIQWLCLLGK